MYSNHYSSSLRPDLHYYPVNSSFGYPGSRFDEDPSDQEYLSSRDGCTEHSSRARNQSTPGGRSIYASRSRYGVFGRTAHRAISRAIYPIEALVTAPGWTVVVITRAILISLALRGAGSLPGRQLFIQGTASPSPAVATIVSAILRSGDARWARSVARMSLRYIRRLFGLQTLPVSTRTAFALSTLGRCTGMCRQPEAKRHLKPPPTSLPAASLTLSPTMNRVGLTPGARHHATSSPRPRPAAALVALTHHLPTPEPPVAKPWLAHIVLWQVAAIPSASAQCLGIYRRLHWCCVADRAGISLQSLRIWRTLPTMQAWSILSVGCAQSRPFPLI